MKLKVWHGWQHACQYLGTQTTTNTIKEPIVWLLQEAGGFAGRSLQEAVVPRAWQISSSLWLLRGISSDARGGSCKVRKNVWPSQTRSWMLALLSPSGTTRWHVASTTDQGKYLYVYIVSFYSEKPLKLVVKLLIKVRFITPTRRRNDK